MEIGFDLDSAIRKVPDFPHKGILFYDITSILTDPTAFRFCVDRMLEIYDDADMDAVAAIEARGFLFAAPFARERNLPLILVRKKGKLPGETYSRSFKLEYGTDSIEIQREDLRRPRRILLVDDLIATGGTLRAAAEIIEDAGSTVAGIFSVIGLPFLKYSEILGRYRTVTLIDYAGE